MMSVSAAVELLEAEAWAQMHSAWAAEAPEATAVKRWGRATALVTPGVEAVGVNRAIGLGCEEPLSRQQLIDVRDFYRAAGRTPWFVEWSPDAQSSQQRLLEACGGQLRTFQAKMFALLEDTRPQRDTGTVEVQRLSPESRSTFRDLVAPALGVPEAGRAGIVAPLGQTGWHFYLARIQDEAIAGAAMFANGQGAWFGLGATLPAHRNMGAQSALLAARIHDARALGCKWVSAETYPTSADTNPSLRNMQRAGMQVLYHRAIYRFEERASR